MNEPTEPVCPGARAPERSFDVDRGGPTLRCHEWGDPKAPPLLLCHGMFDHGRGFDRVAPFFAEHFRVVAMDARGHGDSAWADAYTWEMDVLDVVRVLQALGEPAHLLGHSKGGGQATDAAIRAPGLVRRLVDIDGFGPPPEGFAPMGGGAALPLETEPPERFARHLDQRRAVRGRRVGFRTYASFEALVARRKSQNPRLEEPWLSYFCFHAARLGEGGWSWKADPYGTLGFGPFRPEWVGPGWRALEAPMLAVIGSVADAWGPLPESVLAPRLANVPRLERATIEGAGHFAHMEEPEATARVVLDFLLEDEGRRAAGSEPEGAGAGRLDAAAEQDAPAQAAEGLANGGRERLALRNGRVALTLEILADAPGTPLLLLHALGADVGRWSARANAEVVPGWPGPVYALHFSGHGASSWVHGGVYTPEILAADADQALEAIADRHADAAVRVAGEGVGAYAALLLAGARPDLIEATLLLPGAGLAGGGGDLPEWSTPMPGPSVVLEELAASHAARADAAGCDPALAALERDVRPADYVASFARRARGLVVVDAGGDGATPPWWAAVRSLPGTTLVAGDLAAGVSVLGSVDSLRSLDPDREGREGREGQG